MHYGLGRHSPCDGIPAHCMHGPSRRQREARACLIVGVTAPGSAALLAGLAKPGHLWLLASIRLAGLLCSLTLQVEAGVPPDLITYSSLITACQRAGKCPCLS